MEVQTECSDFKNLLVKSAVTLKVITNFNRIHKDIYVRATAYDEIIKRKNVQFLRKLEPNDELSKPIILPANTATCDCVFISSETE